MDWGHSSPPAADILMDYMYNKALNEAKVNPTGLCLYVDDSWGIWTEGKERYMEFINTLNSIWPTVIFESTLQDEDKRIIFLDLKIKILKKCKDTLGAFLAEDHYIKTCKPILNNNFGDGFSF